MAKQRPEKKPSPGPARVLPMQLQLGDRLVDETGEWEVMTRPGLSGDGKTTRVRVRRVDQPAVVELRSWGSHERVAVTRPGGA